LEDTSKPDDKVPVEPSENIKEKEIEQKQSEQDSKEKKQKDNIKQEPSEEIKIESKEKTIEKTEEKSDEIKDKKEEKTEKVEKKKKSDKNPDFKYIIRLSNTDINGEKKLIYGISSVKGIGLHMASLIAENIGIDKNKKVGDLTDAQVEKIQETIDKVGDIAPSWMLNHRKDYETGEDIHLVSSDIDMKLRDEINIMKKIRSYRGIRHERGLPVRGQRTRANNRKGLTLGVSKKRVQSKK
jgi:small subunit ribosomal protein S13